MMGEEQISTEIREKQNAWKKEVEKILKGKKVESLIKMSDEGFAIKPLYDESDAGYHDTSRVSLYRNNHQSRISQLITAKDSKDLKEKINYAKQRGQHSFYLTNIDFISNEKDVNDAFSSINWNEDCIYIDVGENIGFLPFFFHHQKMHQHYKHTAGTIGFDPYEELLLKGENKVSLDTKFDFLADTMKWSSTNEGSVRCLLIKGNIYSNAGANALQELVFTFSHALDLINELMNRGLGIDEIANSLTVSIGVGSNFFMELAKLRAARDIWASLVHAFGGNPQELPVNIHAITTTFNKTVFDVHVNLLRTTTESFSAVVAGVDELTILPFDYFLNPSSNLADRIARNTHFILKEEGLLSKVIDPSAGSYYVEELTSQLGMEAWERIRQIDQEGGFLHQLRQGKIQVELENMREKRKSDVNNRNHIIIGTNAYAVSNEKVTLKHEKKGRNPEKFTTSIHSFQEAITFIERDKKVPSIGREKQNKQIRITPIQSQRLVEHFEKLRFQAENAKEKGQILKVGIITFGKIKDFKQSLDYISGVLAAGGIETEQFSWNDLKYLSHLQSVILCGKKEDIQVVDFAYIHQLKVRNPSLHIYVMGNEKEMVEKLELAGMISMNGDLYQFLLNMHTLLGVEK